MPDNSLEEEIFSLPKIAPIQPLSLEENIFSSKPVDLEEEIFGSSALDQLGQQAGEIGKFLVTPDPLSGIRQSIVGGLTENVFPAAKRLGAKTLATTIQTTAVETFGQGFQALDAIAQERVFSDRFVELTLGKTQDNEVEKAIDPNSSRMDVFERTSGFLEMGFEAFLQGFVPFGHVGLAEKIRPLAQAPVKLASETLGTVVGTGLELGLQGINAVAGEKDGKVYTERLAELGRNLEERGKRAIEILGSSAQRSTLTELASAKTFSAAMGAMWRNPSRTLEDLIATAPQFMFQFAAASKGPLALSLTVGIQELGPSYDQAVERGMDPDQAVVEAVQSSLNQGFLARGGAALASKKLMAEALLDFGARTGLQMVWEAGGEELNRFILNQPGQSTGEVILAMGLEAVYGAPVDYYAVNRQSILSGKGPIRPTFGAPLAPNPLAFRGGTFREVYVNVRNWASQLKAKQTRLDRLIGQEESLSPEVNSPIPNDLGDLSPDDLNSTSGFVVTSKSTSLNLQNLTEVEVPRGDVAVVTRLFEQDLEFAREERRKLQEKRGRDVITEDEFEFQDAAAEIMELRHQDAVNHQKNWTGRLQRNIKAVKDKFAPDVTLKVIDLGTMDPTAANRISLGRTEKIFFGENEAIFFLDSSAKKFWKTTIRSRNGQAKTGLEFNMEALRVEMAKAMGKVVVREAYDKGLSPSQQRHLRGRYEKHLENFLDKPLSRFAAQILPGPLYADLVGKYFGESHISLRSALESPVTVVRELAESLADYGNYLGHNVAKAMLHGEPKRKAGGLSPEILRLFGRVKGRLTTAYEGLSGLEIQKEGNATDFLKITQAATDFVAGGPKQTLTFRPKTSSQIWSRIDPEALAEGRLAAQDLSPLVGDTTFDPAERRAMRVALAHQGIGPLNAEFLAQGFDTALKFERQMDDWFNQLNRFQKFVTRLKPDERPEWTPDLLKFNRWLIAPLYTLQQMRQINPTNPYISQYVESWRGRTEDKVGILEQGDEILVGIRDNLSTGQEDVLGRILVEQTSRNRRLTEPEMRDMKAVPATMDMANKITDLFESFIPLMEELELESLENPTPERVQEIRDKYSRMRGRAYFPLSRFGDRVISLTARTDLTWRGTRFRTGQQMFYSLAEGKGAQEEVRLELQRELDGLGIRDQTRLSTPRKAISKQSKMLEGMPIWIWESMRERVSRLKEVPESVIRGIDQLIRANAPENAFTKRLMTRRGTKGFSSDAVRSVASYIHSFANYHSRLKFEPAQKKIIDDLGKAIAQAEGRIDVEGSRLRNFLTDVGLGAVAGSSRPEVQLHKMGVLQDYMARHLENQGSIKSELAGLRQMGFFWYLALNAKSWFVNGTQVPLVAFPYLSASVGGKVAGEQILSAYKTFTRHKLNYTDAMPEWLGDVMLRLEKSGVLNQSLYREMATVANGGLLQNFLGTRRNRGFQQFMHGVSGPFQMVESVNRWVTAVAAIKSFQEVNPDFRLTDAKRDKDKEDVLFEFARDAIDNTMFEYSKWNRAAIFSGKRGAIFLFQSFLQNVLFQVTRGNTASFRMLLAMFVAGGSQGMPGVEDVEDVVEAALTVAKKKDINVRSWLRQVMDENELPSDFLMDGAGRSGFGWPALMRAIGIPLADVDLSGSLGYGRIAPFSAAEGVKNLATGGFDVEKAVSRGVEKGGQAVGAMLFSVLRAADTRSEADWLRRVEMILPKGIPQGMVTAYRWGRDRRETTSFSGKPILRFDLNDPVQFSELAEKAVGFQPRRLNEAREVRRWVQEREFYYGVRREYITESARKFRKHKLEGDQTNPLEWQEIRKEIRKWNADMRRRGLRKFVISEKGLRQQARGLRDRKRLADRGIISPRAVGPEFDELDFLKRREKEEVSLEDQIFITDLP